jgi:hypothetical protein
MSRPKLLVLPLVLAACTDHALVPPHPMPEEQTDTYAPINPSRKVDVLFMVDNSLSMKEEQDNLARNFPAFIDQLRKFQGGLPDVHIAVVTSDLGAGRLDESGCSPGGQQGLFQGWDKGCGLDGESRFLVASNGERNRNYQGDLSTAFACMAGVGTGGCGFEHQLASTVQALTAQPANAGFLRDDAYLQIVLITDEDDCSADANSPLFTQDFPGEEPSLRCARVGHVCQGKMPPAADFSAPLAACKPVENGPLSNVQGFVDRIRALKKNPDMILVSGIFGWPTSGSGTYTIGKQTDPMTGRLSGWDYLPACMSANGTATAALRVKQFVDAFGVNGSFESICADDFRPVLDRIGEKLRIWGGALCIGAPPVDTSPAPGVQPDCVVSERVPGHAETPLPACGGGEVPCWRVKENRTWCPAYGLELEIDRGGQPEPTDVVQSARCRTCLREDDPRCPR